MDQPSPEAEAAHAGATADTPGPDSDKTREHASAPSASDAFKSTAKDAWESVKGLWKDPETSHVNALETLGSQKAMFTGLFIMVAIAALNYLLIRIALPGDFAPLFNVENSVRLVALYTFPSLSLAIVFLVMSKMLKRDRSYKDCIFISSMITAPLVLPMAALVVFGYSNVEIVLAVLIAALCFMTLLTYSAYRHVLTCAARVSFILTPLTLLGMVYITSVLSRMWMESWFQSLARGLRYL